MISPQVFQWIKDAETNIPYIERQDLWGNTKNELITSDGWKRLKDFGVSEGMLSTFYDGKYKQYARIIGFTKNYLFSPSSALITCPFAMTDGCARACQLFGPFDASGTEYYNHLVSSDPSFAWTSGQWMTERTGGSDVSQTETVAVPNFEKGPKQYKLSGFKWFSSATDSQVTITLARIGDDKRLSCFIVPVTQNVKEGAIVINRLKKKFGTVALPTAELELHDVEGELVGARGKGISVISTVLNITRIYSCVGSASFIRRSLHIAREYSLVRKVFKQHLCDLNSHVKILAEQETLARGLYFLGMFACESLGAQEYGVENKHQQTLNRIVPGIAKAYSCKKAVPAISECMEALGGVGYLEFDVEFNIARLLRDAQVNTIWEGTTNVLSDDFIRFLMNNINSVIDALGWFVNEKTNNNNDSYPENPEHPKASSSLNMSKTSGKQSPSKPQIISKLKQKNVQDIERWVSLMSGSGNFEASSGVLSQHAREYLMELAEILISTLLISDASRVSDPVNDSVSLEIATRWTLRDLSRSLFLRQNSYKLPEEYSNLYVGDDSSINKLIVYGPSNTYDVSTSSKL